MWLALPKYARNEESRTPDLPGNAGTLYFNLNPNMVGTRRLELLTSTVSNLRPEKDEAIPRKRE
jgi:hypothetical protein